MWEFDHLVENAVKYKLWPEQQAGAKNGLPVCSGGTSYLTTSMLSACYNVSAAVLLLECCTAAVRSCGGGSAAVRFQLACRYASSRATPTAAASPQPRPPLLPTPGVQNATGQYEGYGLMEWNDCTGAVCAALRSVAGPAAHMMPLRAALHFPRCVPLPVDANGTPPHHLCPTLLPAAAKPQNITLFASGTLLPRSQCPWPMLLNSTAPKGEQSGYEPAFDFTKPPVRQARQHGRPGCGLPPHQPAAGAQPLSRLRPSTSLPRPCAGPRTRPRARALPADRLLPGGGAGIRGWQQPKGACHRLSSVE